MNPANKKTYVNPTNNAPQFRHDIANS